MKLFLKILLFIVAMIIITLGDAKSSNVVTILQEETSSSFIQKSQLSVILFENHSKNSCLNEKVVVTYSEQLTEKEENVAKGGKMLKGVEADMRIADEIAGFIKDGKYLDNPTKTLMSDLQINPSGTVKGKLKLDPTASNYELLNGEYMYVVDENNQLILGSRAKWGTEKPFNEGRAPHPTLIGGSNPQVQAAGMIEFRGGKIYKIDNASGHFKPSNETLLRAEEIFKQNFNEKSFSNDFQGFVPYGN